jgi:hypothetical protein
MAIYLSQCEEKGRTRNAGATTAERITPKVRVGQYRAILRLSGYELIRG